MIAISQVAAERIRKAAEESGAQPPVIRIAAQRAGDGTIDFGMGFDQQRTGDTTVEIEGIVVVVAPQSRELVDAAHVDFVEVEPGDFRFVFAVPGESQDE
jgi:iron-sulfur cluster assembly protein